MTHYVSAEVELIIIAHSTHVETIVLLQRETL